MTNRRLTSWGRFAVVMAGLILTNGQAAATKLNFSPASPGGLILIQNFPYPLTYLYAFAKVHLDTRVVEDKTFTALTADSGLPTPGFSQYSGGKFGFILAPPGYYFLHQMQSSGALYGTHWCLRDRAPVFEVRAGRITIITGQMLGAVVNMGPILPSIAGMTRDVEADARAALQKAGSDLVNYEIAKPVGFFRIGEPQDGLDRFVKGCNHKGVLSAVE